MLAVSVSEMEWIAEAMVSNDECEGLHGARNSIVNSRRSVHGGNHAAGGRPLLGAAIALGMLGAFAGAAIASQGYAYETPPI
jgi:hypothetical protein